jgi:hypothetical protein
MACDDATARYSSASNCGQMPGKDCDAVAEGNRNRRWWVVAAAALILGSQVLGWGLGSGLGLQAASAQGYQRIAAALDGPPNADASLSAARDELLAIVIRSDRAALNKRVAKTFFWDRDHGGAFNPKRSAAANLAAATTWKSLRSMLSAETATPRRSGSMDYCMPAQMRPQDQKNFERVAEQLQTDTFFDWGVITSENQPVRAGRDDAAAEIGVLSREVVRVTEWAFDAPEGQQRWVEVITPAGAKGYVDGRRIQTLAPERLCLRKAAGGGWHISGYMGGGD